MILPSHPRFVDLSAIETGDPSLSLPRALDALRTLYRRLDAKLDATTARLALPCREPPPDSHHHPRLTILNDTVADGSPHCSQCCHESVFLTPLEWFLVVDHMQTHFTPAALESAVAAALGLYAQHHETIEAFSTPPPAPARDHFALARALRFTCPLLGANACTVYPARELFGRLFGQSTNAENGIYGCELSGIFFKNDTHTLVSAEAWARQLAYLPLTGFRQVYPYYFMLTYGNSA